MTRSFIFLFDLMARQIRSTHLFSPQNRWFITLFTELTVTNMTHFGMLAVLAVTLADNMHFSAPDTAALLAITSLGLRGSRVVFAPFIDRIAPRHIIPIAILCSISGYLGMIAAREFWPVASCLLLVGIGYGVNSMLVTTLASYTVQRSGSAFPMYALMNTGVNLAAAIAPIIFNALRLNVSTQTPFAFAAAILCVSLAISVRIRVDVPHVYRETSFFRAAGTLLSTPRYLLVLCFVVMGWALNTQKFAATPLFINEILDRPHYIGLAVGLEALIGLFVSLPMSSYIRYHDIKSRDVLGICFILYMLAYGILAVFPTLTGLWSGLVFWSLAESLLMPQLNTLIAQYTSSEHRLAGFSLAAAAIGIGEAFGNASGVALIAFSLSPHHVWICYTALTLAATIALACSRFLKESGPQNLKDGAGNG